MPPSITRTWRTPGSDLDLIGVGGFHFAGKHGRLLNRCVQHSRQLDVDAEERLAGDDRVGIYAGLRMANDAVILGVFELDAASARAAGSVAALAASSP